jgi:hypothetical protein
LEKPEGWFEYQIRSGDTLSHIAVQSGSTTDTLSDANCIDDARFIVIGQTIFVPQLWEVNITNDTSQSGNEETSSSTTSNSGATSSSDDDNGSSSASDDDDSDDHDDSDDSDNSGSGSDSDNSGSGSDDDD